MIAVMAMRSFLLICALSAVLSGAAGTGTGAALLEPAQSPGELPRKPPPTPQEEARDRKIVLGELLDRLKTAGDPDTARNIEKAIWALWLRSGSPTIDLLMRQATGFMAEASMNKALKLLDRITRLKPDYAEGWNKRATVFFLLRQFERSKSDIEQTLKLEPRHFGALAGLGLVFDAMGDQKRALKAFRQALAVHPFLPGPAQAVKRLGPLIDGEDI